MFLYTYNVTHILLILYNIYIYIYTFTNHVQQKITIFKGKFPMNPLDCEGWMERLLGF